MTTPRDPADAPTVADPSAADPTTQQQGRSLHGEHVPEPASGVRGADQVDRMDPEPGHGTTRGADGDTAAREQQRKDQGERSASAGTEDGGSLEQAGALGATDDPQGGSLQPDGARP